MGKAGDQQLHFIKSRLPGLCCWFCNRDVPSKYCCEPENEVLYSVMLEDVDETITLNITRLLNVKVRGWENLMWELF